MSARIIVVRICVVAVFIEHIDVHVRAVWYVEVPIFAVSDGGSVAVIHQLSVGHRGAVESADVHVPLHVVRTVVGEVLVVPTHPRRVIAVVPL